MVGLLPRGAPVFNNQHGENQVNEKQGHMHIQIKIKIIHLHF